MSAIANVIAIIVAAGLIGGWAAFLVNRAAATAVGAGTMGEDNPTPLATPFVQFLLLGIIASACVPLFLSLLKSGLVASIFAEQPGSDGKAPITPFEDYLVFTGLCLIAGFYARRFIDSVSKQVLQRVEQAQETAAEAVKISHDAKQVASEFAGEFESIDTNSPPPEAAQVVPQPNEQDDDTPISLSDTQRRVLNAMATKTYRTRTGIAEDAGISRDRISEILQDLHDHKFALRTTSPSTGGMRWTISDRGRAALAG